MKIRPIIAWYDFWVGLFWDARKRRLYFLPLPCIGLVVEFQPMAAGEQLETQQSNERE